LSITNSKFIKRFQLLEEFIQTDGKDISILSLSEMDTYWEKAKQKLSQ
jgi:XTP/dITP diphosphohydrolase